MQMYGCFYPHLYACRLRANICFKTRAWHASSRRRILPSASHRTECLFQEMLPLKLEATKNEEKAIGAKLQCANSFIKHLL